MRSQIRSNRDRIAAILASTALLGIATAVVVAATRNQSRSVEAVLAGAAITVALFPLVRRIRTTFDIFEPIVPASVVLAVLFGGRPLVMVADRDLTYAGLPAAARFREAVVAGLLGTIGFIAAHEAVWAPNVAADASHAGRESVRRAVAFAVGALAASIALFTVHLARGPSILESLRLLVRGRSSELAHIYERSSEYLSSAPVLAACGAIVVLAAAGARALSLRARLLVAFAIAFPVAVFLQTGSRRFVVPALLIPGIVWFLSRGRRPRAMVVAVLLPVAFLALATIPYARSSGAREAAGGVLPIFRDAFVRPDRTVMRFLRGNDTEMLAVLSLQIEKQDEPGDFFYGRATLGDLLIAPIPSLVISSKPTTARDEMLTRVFGHRCRVGSGPRTGCPDFSAVGTFYQDLWYPGVVIGTALLGLGTAFLWQRYRRNPQSAAWIVTVASWFVFLPVLLRAGFMPAFAWWLYFLLPSLLGLVLARRRSVRPNGSPQPHLDPVSR